MTIQIVIVGVGGHGRECADITEAMIQAGADIRLAGFFDDHPAEADLLRIGVRGYEVLGDFDDLLKRGGFAACLGIGSGLVRARLDERLRVSGIQSPVLVHPGCTVGSQVSLSEGVVLFPGARLTTNISLGRHVHVNQNATVAHDSILHSYVTVNPMAAVSGNCTVNQGVTLGAGSVVRQGIEIGRSATVGASGCAVSPVPAGVVVVGVPAKPLVRSTVA